MIIRSASRPCSPRPARRRGRAHGAQPCRSPAAMDLREVHIACQQTVTVVGLNGKPRRVRLMSGAMEPR